MDTGDGIRLREGDDGWEAVDEDSGLTGRGESAQEALAVLEARLETRGSDTGARDDPEATPDNAGDAPEPSAAGDEGDGPGLVDTDGLNITISPKVELLFGIAATGFGLIYVVTGNYSGAILVAIGAMLLVRVAWIEYGLFGR